MGLILGPFGLLEREREPPAPRRPVNWRKKREQLLAVLAAFLIHLSLLLVWRTNRQLPPGVVPAPDPGAAACRWLWCPETSGASKRPLRLLPEQTRRARPPTRRPPHKPSHRLPLRLEPRRNWLRHPLRRSRLRPPPWRELRTDRGRRRHPVPAPAMTPSPMPRWLPQASRHTRSLDSGSKSNAATRVSGQAPR